MLPLHVPRFLNLRVQNALPVRACLYPLWRPEPHLLPSNRQYQAATITHIAQPRGRCGAPTFGESSVVSRARGAGAGKSWRVWRELSQFGEWFSVVWRELRSLASKILPNHADPSLSRQTSPAPELTYFGEIGCAVSGAGDVWHQSGTLLSRSKLPMDARIFNATV